MTMGVLFRCGVDRRARDVATLAAGLLLTAACAGPPSETRWVKAGMDDAGVARETNDCQAQASAAQNRQQGINQDISATLGRNWAMSYTTGIQDQSMQRQATGLFDQVFNSCMRGKGFTKQG